MRRTKPSCTLMSWTGSAKTLAAYNGGETRMRKLDRKLDGAAFWEPSMYYSLPAETRDYVPQILAAAWLFLHPEEYGLEFPRLETSTTTIVLNSSTTPPAASTCRKRARGSVRR